MDSPDFLELVALAWNTYFDGSPQYILSQKLKVLKQHLKVFNNQHFSNISRRVEEARDKLFNIQSLMNLHPGDVDLSTAEADALHDLYTLTKAEESFARQKSRAIWMKEGDRYSKYFHGCMRDRVNSNKFTSLELDNGTKIFKPTEIHTAATEYFKSCFQHLFHAI